MTVASRHLSEKALSGADLTARGRGNKGNTWVDGVARGESESQGLDREPLMGVVKKETPVAAAGMVMELDREEMGSSGGELKNETFFTDSSKLM